MQISVVIPTFNRSESVVRLLDGLRAQSVAVDDYEVVVAVDGSTDGTVEALQEYDAPFKLTSLWQPNAGRAAACNRGILAAIAPVVLILDDDMVPSSDLLAAHLRDHADGVRRCVVGAVPVDVGAGSTPLTKYIARKFAAHLERSSAPGFEFGVRDFYSGNASARRVDLVNVGMFDERFVEYGNEDLELAVRLQSAGVRLIYSADASARQQYEKTFQSLASDTIAKGRTVVQFVAKHPAVGAEMPIGQPVLRSRRWRFVRGAVVKTFTVLPPSVRLVVWTTRLFERVRLPRMDLWFAFTLDCFYWFGISQALPASQRASEETQAT